MARARSRRSEGAPSGFTTRGRRRRGGALLAVCGFALCALVALGVAYALLSGSSNSASSTPSSEQGSPQDSMVGPTNDAPQKAPEGGSAGSDEGKNQDAGEAAQPEVAPPPPAAQSCDDLRVLVDKQHSLPTYYAPADLVSLSAYGVPALQGTAPLLRREAAAHLAHLVKAAGKDGQELVVASAYRSYEEQQGTYGQYENIYGRGAGMVSAPPGQSQHQLGTAIDFTNAGADYRLWWPFADTSSSAWLVENAPRYGFVLAYPKGIEDETGYQYEPWHYRYIGVENARQMRDAHMSLQPFLAQQEVVPQC